MFVGLFLMLFHLPASNPSCANPVPTSQSASISNFNEVNNPMLSGSASDHDPGPDPLGGVRVSDHRLDGSDEPRPTTFTSNQNTFQLAPLELGEGEPDIGIYIPALQVTMTNIQKLKNATLEDSGMAIDDVDRLRDPGAARSTLDMSDMHLVKALRHFIYSTDTSCGHYETI
jgi:hypothetical protein